MTPFLDAFTALITPALMDRLVLVVNHVLSREPQAMARLQPHTGKLLHLQPEGWPRLLPAPPTLAFLVTPAGLVEWCAEPGPGAELQVRLDASNPAALALRLMSGRPPELDVAGDAQLAGDVDWLLKNLRWDVADDLQRLFGPLAAGQLQQLGSALSRGLRGALQGLASLAGRGGPGRAD